MIRCGCKPLSNFSYQWSEELGDNKVKAAMKQKRYVAPAAERPTARPCYGSPLRAAADGGARAPFIVSRFLQLISQLSFMEPDDTSYPQDKLRKIRDVDTEVQGNCASAWYRGRYISIDESMIRCLSQFCSFLQFLPRKPIKWGIKAFLVVDAAADYALKWSIYTGKTEASGAEMGMIDQLVCETLLDGSYNNSGTVVFMDSFFCTIAIFKKLALRGIYAVGPCKHRRPNKDAGASSWPFVEMAKTALSYLDRGFRREAKTPIPGTSLFLHASMWVDTKVRAAQRRASQFSHCLAHFLSVRAAAHRPRGEFHSLNTSSARAPVRCAAGPPAHVHCLHSLNIHCRAEVQREARRLRCCSRLHQSRRIHILHGRR